MAEGHSQRPWLLAALLLAVTVGLAYYLTSPMDADIRWPDSMRHALNGVFLYDAIRAWPADDPMSWAQRYYDQYPAITFGFYPPLPALLMAPFYALFGVSTATAALFMATSVALLFFLIYLLAREALAPLPALTAALLAVGTAEILIWGRQVMLEIPMMLFLAGSLLAFLRYLKVPDWKNLAGAVLLMLAAVYCKQTAAFFIPAMAAVFLWQHGLAGLKRLHIWLIALGGLVALGPLVWLQLNFGGFNVMTVVSRPDVPIDRFSIEGLLWYPGRLLEMTNPLFLSLSLAGLAWIGWQMRQRRAEETYAFWALAVTCFLSGLLFLTFISLKETRHAALLILPLSLIAAASLQIGNLKPLQWGLAALSVFFAAVGLAAVRVDTVEGPQRAADEIVRSMPEGGKVAILAYFDGPFIFRIREHDPDRRFHVTRLDKLLLDINIMPQLGLNPRDLSEREIADLIQQQAVSYIVLEPRDYLEADIIQRLHKVLSRAPFEEVARLSTTTHRIGGELIIYRNRAAGSTAPNSSPQTPSAVR